MDPRGHSTLLGIAAAAALAAQAAAATRYVNRSCGNNAWSGTSQFCGAPNGPKATIQAGLNSASPGDEVVVAPGTYPEKIGLPASIVLRSAAGAQATVIDGQQTGTVVSVGQGSGPETVLDGFTITGGYTTGHGGGMVNDGSPTIRNCVFTGNHAGVASCIRSYQGSPLVDRCTFIGNTTIATGTVACNGGDWVFRDCLFQNNDSQFVIFYSDQGGLPQVVNCRFIDNRGVIGAGAIDGHGAVWTNCIFSRNEASGPLTAAFVAAWNSTLVNCTINKSVGEGLALNASNGHIVATNCIIRESSLGSIGLHGGELTVTYSDVEGGWPGTNNIDADPLFVQPGTEDLRLSYGSPCADHGSNAALPPDAADLDGDGNTTEPVPLDLEGMPRVLDGTVDIGATEGQYAPGAPAASEGDIDPGEFAVLVPEGGPLNPLSSPGVILANVSGGDDGDATAIQIDGVIHPDAVGFSDLGSVLVLHTSIANGAFRATVFIPFDSAALGGASPQQVRATWYDPAAGNWALAVWGNVGDSPGFTGPIGQRLYAEAPQGWGVTQDAGDYGVFWDATVGAGFAWANVDHASDFGAGISLCPGDCRQTPDGTVNVVDMLRLLNDFGATAGGPCDVDGDGVIGAADFAALLGAWGPCPVPARKAPDDPGAGRPPRLLIAAPAGSADLDASGAVDQDDLALLQSCWGTGEPGCAADLDGDGTVGVRDYLDLLAQWDQPGAAP